MFRLMFQMFPLVKKCAERLAQNLKQCEENKDFEAKRLEFITFFGLVYLKNINLMKKTNAM